jgi:hypothetical protein
MSPLCHRRYYLVFAKNIYYYYYYKTLSIEKKKRITIDNKEHRNAMQPGFQQNISQKLQCHEGAFVFN